MDLSMDRNISRLLCFLLALVSMVRVKKVESSSSSEILPGREHTVSGLVGGSATLPCEVDLPNCGRVYFITWTKNISSEWRRQYLYSDGVARAMGDFTEERTSFSLNNHSAHLKLHKLSVSDEGIYKCDVTYVRGKCPSLSFVKLFTLITPSSPEMEVEGKNVRNGSTVGPYMEASTFVLECKSSGGRPAPEVTWWNGTRPLPVKTTVIPEGNGTYLVTSTARFILSRWDLGGRVECRVRTNDSEHPIQQWVKLDVHVRPVSLTVRGPTTPVVAGEMVTLTCSVEGARPSANITWYNRSEVIRPQPQTMTDLMSDGTYRTSSSLVLVGSRYDHKGEFFCKGINDVLKRRLEAPLLQATTLEVLYPPAVFVTPDGTVTVQEKSEVVITCVFDANPPDVTEIVWYKDSSRLQRDSSQRLETRHPLSAVLSLFNLSRHDSGAYSCHVRNAFGRGNSTSSAILNVLFPQVVEIKISSHVVSEGGINSELSLTCEAVDGNPKNFTSVHWFKNGEITNETQDSELRLISASRHHGGNYSCAGLNAAGWSKKSKEEELVVHYTPGTASINQQQELAVKGRSVDLECRVTDSGYPPSIKYLWKKDLHTLNETGPFLHIKPVTVSTQGNYSCAAVNKIGSGPVSYYVLSAVAPPSFVRKLPENGGVLRNTTNVQLFCHIECDPLCEFEWLRNNESLRDSIVFESKTTKHNPDPKSNLFSSISSTLTWNMSLLPANSFDYATFSCRSSGNEIGPGISSTMFFRVENSPENIQISAVRLEVMEGEILDDLVCSASAHPVPKFLWKVGDFVVASGPVLTFNSSLTRSMGGNYTCVVSNRHGTARATVSITVLHRPICTIWKEYTDKGVILNCKSNSSPPAFNFTWFQENLTIFSEIRAGKIEESTISISGENPNIFGRYACIAINEIGASEACFLDLNILPEPAGWVRLFLREENILVIAGVAGAIGFLLIVFFATATVILLQRRLKSNCKEVLREAAIAELPDRGAADCTPIGVSPLLSSHRQDDSPLLRKKRKEHECIYHEPSLTSTNGLYRSTHSRKHIG